MQNELAVLVVDVVVVGVGEEPTTVTTCAAGGGACCTDSTDADCSCGCTFITTTE